MALLDIANEGLKVNFAKVSPAALSYSGDQSIDAVKIVPVKSTKSKAGATFICIEKITLTFVVARPCPHTLSAHTFVSGSGSITALAQKVKTETKLVLRKDDTGTCSGTWTRNSDGTVVPCSCNLKIADAGQTKVKGN